MRTVVTIICLHLINLELKHKIQRNTNSFSVSSKECLAWGKPPETWISLYDTRKNRETARLMSRKIQKLVFPRK